MAADQGAVFELRVYRATPGKRPLLEARFRDHTMDLFAKHGMRVVNFWVALDDTGEPIDTLVYVLGFESRAAADAAWASFRVDPDWVAAREASEVDGPLVTSIESTYLASTDFAPPA
jgi:NIPSNAP